VVESEFVGELTSDLERLGEIKPDDINVLEEYIVEDEVDGGVGRITGLIERGPSLKFSLDS
jgi:hypothetical protein